MRNIRLIVAKVLAPIKPPEVIEVELIKPPEVIEIKEGAK